ncbi:MAG TPA: hypothetical protein VJ044_09960 [Candidatus Hodarchaeales archaeon]|nr:hypothetical protein [Candidatus Hodarchaeales archaeon]
MANETPLIRLEGSDLVFYGHLYPCLEEFPHNSETARRHKFFPCHFPEIREKLDSFRLEFRTSIPFLPAEFSARIPESGSPRSRFSVIIDELFHKWEKQGYRGIAILPKQISREKLILEILRRLSLTALIIATGSKQALELKVGISDLFNSGSELIGSSESLDSIPSPILVLPNALAAMNAQRFNQRFGLLLVVLQDPESDVSAAKGYVSPYRLTILADQKTAISTVPNLTSVGFGQVMPLEGLNSWNYSGGDEPNIIVIQVKKTDSVRHYHDDLLVFADYLRRNRLLGPDGIQRLHFKSLNDREAYIMVQKLKHLRKEAFLLEEKLQEIERLFAAHSNDKIIIASSRTDFCERVSREFFVPSITNRTRKRERDGITQIFRRLANSKICVGRILGECPEVRGADIGIFVAYDGQESEFRGILSTRLKEGDESKPIIYQIVSETVEESIGRLLRTN